MDKQFVREYWRQEREEQRLEELNMAWGHQLPSGGSCPFEGLTEISPRLSRGDSQRFDRERR